MLARSGAVPALRRGTLDRVTQDGNTALHYGALYNQPNCLKLLLKGKAAFTTGTGPGYRAGGGGTDGRTDLGPSLLLGAVPPEQPGSVPFHPSCSERGRRDGAGRGEEAEAHRVRGAGRWGGGGPGGWGGG